MISQTKSCRIRSESNPQNWRTKSTQFWELQKGQNSKAGTALDKILFRIWYLCWNLTNTREGKLALERQAAELAEHIWRTWSPTWKFASEELQAVLPSFNNALFAETVVSYYQHRWNVGIDSPAYRTQQAALRAMHTVDVPTSFICGDADACTLPAVSRNVERFYKAGYERIELPGVGHFPHREHPTAVADLVLRFVDG